MTYSGDVEMYQVIVGNYDERQKVSQLHVISRACMQHASRMHIN